MNRPTDPGLFPIDKPVSDEAKEAARLHADWRDRFARVEKVERDYAAARRAVREADVALQEALSAAELSDKPDDKAVRAAEKAYAVAKAEAEAPWRHRIAAAATASEAARTAFSSYLNENLETILDEPELREEAEAAQAAFVEAAEALVAAAGRWTGAYDAYDAILRHAEQIDGRALPRLGDQATAASRAARALLNAQEGAGRFGEQPVPLPSPSRRHLDQRRIARGEEPVGNYGTDGGPNTIRLSP